MKSWRKAGACLLGICLSVGWYGLSAESAAAPPKPANQASNPQPAPAATPTEPRLSLEFRDASIDSVLQLFSMAGGKTIIKDPAVTGNITLLGKRDVPMSEALELLQEALQMRGAVVRVTADIIEVLPASRAQAASSVVTAGQTLPTGNNLVTYILPVRGLDATALRTQLAPLFSGDASIAANSETNTLVITDFANHVARIAEIVGELQSSYDATMAARRAEQERAAAQARDDARARTQAPNPSVGPAALRDVPQVEIIKLRYADARTLSNELRQILRGAETSPAELSNQMLQQLRQSGIDPQMAQRLLQSTNSRYQAGNQAQQILANSAATTSSSPILENKVIADTYTNSLIVTGAPTVIRAVAELVAKLDVNLTPQQPTYDIRIIRLQYADSRSLAQVLNDIANQAARRLQSAATTGGAGPVTSGVVSLSGVSAKRSAGNLTSSDVAAGKAAPSNTATGTDPATATSAAEQSMQQLRDQLQAAVDSGRLGNLSAEARANMADQIRHLRSDRLTQAEQSAAQTAAASPKTDAGDTADQAVSALARGGFLVVADTQSNSLVVLADSATHAEIEQLVSLLDIAPASQQIAVITVPLKNADAANLASILNQFFAGTRSGSAADTAVRNLSSGNAANNAISRLTQAMQGWNRNANPLQSMQALRDALNAGGRNSNQQAAPRQSRAEVAVAPVPSGSNLAQAQGYVRIIAEPATNSLLISVPAEVVDDLRTLIAELDQPALSADYVTLQYNLLSASASAVAQAITQFYNQTALDSQGNVVPLARAGSGSRAIQVRAVAGPSGDTLLVLVPKAIAARVDELVQGLDRAPADEVPNVSWVQEVRFADVNSLSQVLVTYLRGIAASQSSSQPGNASAQSAGATAANRNAAAIFSAATRNAATNNRNTTPTTAANSSQDVWIVPEAASRRLLISVPKTLEAQVRSLLQELDREDLTSRYIVERVALQNADAAGLAQVVNQIYQGLNFIPGSGFATRTQTNQTQGSIRVVAERSTNSLLVVAPAEALEEVRTLVADLDMPLVVGNSIRVVALANARATDLATTLNQAYSALISNTGQAATQATVPTASVVTRTANQANTPAAVANRANQTVLPTPAAGAARTNQTTAAGSVRFIAESNTNSLLVIGPEAQLDDAVAFVGQFDRPPQISNNKVRQVPLTYATASTLASLITQLYQSMNTAMRASGNELRAVADAGTNQLLLLGPEAVVAEAEKLARDLDQPSTASASGSISVYRVQNARATELATVLNSLFSGSSSGTQARTNTTTNTAVNNASRSTVASAGATGAGQAAANQAGAVVAQSTTGGAARNTSAAIAPYSSENSNLAYANVRVIADPASNTLLFIGPPEVLPEVKSVTQQLDVMPPQVLIEAVVVEMSLDNNRDMGIQWKWANPQNGNSEANSASVGLGNLVGALGSKYSILTQGLEVVLSTLAGDSKMNVVSTPRILAANDTPATINIVTQIPYIDSERKEGNVVTSTWAFKNVGVTLEVTPRIGDSGQVYLDLYQTTDSFTQDTMSGRPIINTRETKSTLVVQDQQTLVLGGLMRDNISTATQKVPLLGDLPIVGALFRTEKQVNSKTELVVFVRPTIVRTQGDAAAVTQREIDRAGSSDALRKAGAMNP